LTTDKKYVMLIIEREGNMTEIRFSYNPFTEEFIESNVSHSIAIYNQGKQKQFDEFIRGIILNGVLYLRLYYPFDNLSDLSLTELKQSSRELLELNQLRLVSIIYSKYQLEITEIKFNVENDLLKGIGLANI